jgi:hypothetical protein
MGTRLRYGREMARRGARANEPLDKKSLESFKAFLGPIAAQYSDSQLIQLRSEMHVAARLLLDLYLLEKRPNDPAPKAFDNPEPET